ncbi:MAG: hypothetical protein GQ477_05820, partial [Nanohaloarchaea archaeon]|nr:hypothetical protein [Candidatus Nanohaloarchaea archaeon]
KGTDAEGDTVTTYIYVGTTSTPTDEEGNTTAEIFDLGNNIPLSEGVTYYYRLRSWDGYEYSNYTIADEFGLNIVPLITFSPPTYKNNSFINQNYTFINWSITEENLDINILNWNNTNYTMFQDYSNMTDLVDGTYTYYVWVNDTIGNENQTEIRTLTIDTTDSQIGFVVPTEDNDSYINENYTYINVTATDTNNITAFIDWNNSLIGWWRFNNESDFTDYSSYENDGSNSGSTYTESGKFGGAIEFDGSNDYVYSSDILNNYPDDFTVTAWIKINTAPADASKYDVFSRWSGNNPFSGFVVYVGGTSTTCPTKFQIQYYENSASATDDFCSSTTWSIGTWYYLTYVHNSSGWSKFYIGGLLSGEESSTTTWSKLGTFDQPFTIGARDIAGSITSYFNGTIDEVKIWNRALTPAEINASYNAGLYRLEANITDLADGTYTYTAYAQDLAGNVNNTETRTLTIDITDPQIEFVAPTEDNNSYINKNYTYINWSITETNLNTTIMNWNGINWTLINSSVNITGLADGIYTYYIWANDTADNENQSETRTLTIDTFASQFSDHIISPDPPNEDQSVQLNVTITEINKDTIWLQFDNNSGSINYTITTNNGDEFYHTIAIGNYTAHDQINYSWWSNDSAGNLNSSDIQTFTVANQIPTVTAPLLNSTAPKTDETLSCNGGTFSDNDAEDAEQSRQYRWYDTDTEIAGETSSTLDLTNSGLDKSDTIKCSIRVSDGYGNSSWVNSTNTATIVNSVLEILLTFPGDSDYSRQTFNFTYTVIDLDTISDVDYCELWTDVNSTGWTLHNNNTGPQSTNNVTYTVATLPTEQIETIDWYVNCT